MSRRTIRRMIEFGDKTRIDGGRRDEERRAVCIFVLLFPLRRVIRLLVIVAYVVVFVLFHFFLPRERLQRSTAEEVGEEEARVLLPLHGREKRFQSKKGRVFCPAHPTRGFPPALEPLNHSVVQRFEVSVVLNAE